MASSAPSDLHALVIWQTLLATVIGGLLAFFGNFVAKLWERSQQRRAIRAAFGAEIASLLKITAVRRHEENAQNWIDAWNRGEDLIPKMYGDVPREDPVYARNVDKIGMLGADAADVVLFYTNINAIRVHLRAIVSGDIKTMPIANRARFLQPALDLWRETKPLAESLVSRLNPRRR